ncbi:hypothetical protein D9V80_01335 [Buchnera aphidicola (Thelaxes californica)]|uniref:Basal body P-ring protein n=1 Tax=Buchnera aphidicola (Thelaxes californica) TaxID=1315998 RepID=A0A4D6YBQ1_9GAMM|nr:flagellar basal body P-ring protein FlgI [Buchnera aphidicola]QCI26799.1 hypothetical protein D9V80_01335 [Buchnera aphidicola (Thelaxes californica)]
MNKILSSKIILLLCLFFIPYVSKSEIIGNLTNIKQIQDHPLIGYGLVIGLNGTGDQMNNTPFSNSTLQSMLHTLKIDIPDIKDAHITNIASVIVVGKINVLSQLGENIDITVSSIGNATSLSGGVLLMTPLKGIDNKVYAIAQGTLIKKTCKPVSEMKNSSHRLTGKHLNKKNEINTGFIPNGGVIQSEIDNDDLQPFKKITLILKKKDFKLAKKIADTINALFPNIAEPVNEKIIQIHHALKNTTEQIKLISTIQNLEIKNQKQQKNHVPVTINLSKNVDPNILNINNYCFIKNNVLKYKNISIIFHNKINNFQKNPDILIKKINAINIHNSNNNNIFNLDINELLNILKYTGFSNIEIASILESMKTLNFFSYPIEISQ